MSDRIRLDGRVAVVPGAAGVIGSATIRLLAERGAKIVAADRNTPKTLRTKDGLALSRVLPWRRLGDRQYRNLAQCPELRQA
jgi:NAD(P)-dependent dehydrogenase (short-subunit alcohol dehydrogenase family)